MMRKITFFGGDGRLLTARDALRSAGYTVDSVGLTDGDNGSPESSDILVLPVPATRDRETVNCPLTGRRIPLSGIEPLLPGRLVLSGGKPFSGEGCIDYCACDGYALRNAVPTAEGAIALAIRETPFTLWQHRVLVIGYGRVGKVLCDRLNGLRCRVTVSARKETDFALLDALGIRHIRTGTLADAAAGFDLIFNTVDAPVLDGAAGKLTGKTVIDLSSKGCFSSAEAADGIHFFKAPGLPGKTAPETAGKILAETLLEQIERNA